MGCEPAWLGALGGAFGGLGVLEPSSKPVLRIFCSKAVFRRQALVRSMVTRENKWHPRYGVRPGYGDISHDGLLSVGREDSSD